MKEAAEDNRRVYRGRERERERSVLAAQFPSTLLLSVHSSASSRWSFNTYFLKHALISHPTEKHTVHLLSAALAVVQSQSRLLSRFSIQRICSVILK